MLHLFYYNNLKKNSLKLLLMYNLFYTANFIHNDLKVFVVVYNLLGHNFVIYPSSYLELNIYNLIFSTIIYNNC